MPLTEKGEKIKSAMERQYGEEKGEDVFYASKNKGTITGVDAMPGLPSKIKLDELAIKADALVQRFDAFMRHRYEKRRRIDAFEEARHPRNAGGVFTAGEGEEGKEKTDAEFRGAPVVNKPATSPHSGSAEHPDFKQDASHISTGALSKKKSL